jgi:predicted membrane chloride channel (bestrophin family)
MQVKVMGFSEKYQKRLKLKTIRIVTLTGFLIFRKAACLSRFFRNRKGIL